MLLVMIVLFGAMSIVFLMGKGSFLIAGYNTANAQQKAMYDEKKLCHVMGLGTSVMTLSLMIAQFNEDFAGYSVVGGIVIGLVVIFVGNHTYAKMKDYEWVEIKQEKKQWYKSTRFYKTIISIVVLVVVVIMMFTGSVDIELGDKSLLANGFMTPSITINYQDIEEVTYQKDIKLGRRNWGVESFRIQAGNFKNDEFGEYKLYSYAKCHDYVVLKTKDGYIIFNDSNQEKTKIIYEKLLQLTK